MDSLLFKKKKLQLRSFIEKTTKSQVRKKEVTSNLPSFVGVDGAWLHFTVEFGRPWNSGIHVFDGEDLRLPYPSETHRWDRMCDPLWLPQVRVLWGSVASYRIACITIPKHAGGWRLTLPFPVSGLPRWGCFSNEACFCCGHPSRRAVKLQDSDRPFRK